MTQSVSSTVRRQQMINKLGHLTAGDLFGYYTRGEPEWIAKIGTPATLEAEDTLDTVELQDQLLWLKQGRIQVSRVDAGGNKTAIMTLEPGAVFGQMSMLGQGMQNLVADALEACSIVKITRDDLEKLFAERPDIAMRVLDILGRRLIEAESRLEDIAFKSIPARLASLLLRLLPTGKEVIIGYTHQELADMIGTYRETTTQTLNHFKSQGLLEIGRKRIAIRNREALQRLAEW
jgi:CRP-like cAMP-binding protein